MRAVLGFDGTAHELLTDLAGDGGAVLFVDNVDLSTTRNAGPLLTLSEKQQASRSLL